MINLIKHTVCTDNDVLIALNNFYYGGGCGEARWGETSKWPSLSLCAGLVSLNSLSWGGVWSGDSPWSTSGFLMSCGSFRNLRRDSRESTIKKGVLLWKKQEDDEGKETWRGVFVPVLSWWCSACSSAAMHGTFSHRSYCLGSIEWEHTSLSTRTKASLRTGCFAW